MENNCYTWPWKPMDTIPVDNELNTLLKLNPEFPLAISHDDLSTYKNGFVNWHKQSSVEISIVTEGTIIVNLLNHQETISAGEGYLLFPGVLHHISNGTQKNPARCETLFFEPHLITGFRGSYFEKSYYKSEIIRKNTFLHFSMTKEPFCLLADDFHHIFQDDYWEDAYRKNQIQHRLQNVWIALWNHIALSGAASSSQTDDAKLLKMIDFLQKNHQQKFSLDDLCNHINLSRSTCCRYFKQMMQMSISDYLLEYRLSQALFMLDTTDKSITEIAYQTGFSTTSYFISKFKEKMQITPLEYQKRKR